MIAADHFLSSSIMNCPANNHPYTAPPSPRVDAGAEGRPVLERERHKLILKLVNERAIMAVGDLVEILDASEATIRRDIALLDRNGGLRRVRGGVEALKPRFHAHLVGVPFALSRQVRITEKQAIARAALPLLQDCSSIIINAGTTMFEFARAMHNHDLDVLTNSLSIAGELLSQSRCRITLPGGTVFPEHNIILSPFENDAIANFAADVLFTSCYGLGPGGMTEMDPHIAHASEKLMRRAQKVVVLADSSKLALRSSMVIAPLERIDAIVTDSAARESDLEFLRQAGIRIHIAECAGPAVMGATQ